MSVRSKPMIVILVLMISCALSAAALSLTEKSVQQPVFPWRDYVLKLALVTDNAAEVNHDSGNLMLRFEGESCVIALSDIEAYAGDFFLRDKRNAEHAPLTFRVNGVGFHDGAFSVNSHQDGFELIYQLDSDSWEGGLSLLIGAQEQQERFVMQLLPVDGAGMSPPVPAEFVGSWQGCAEVSGSDIYLAFTVREDGSGTYAFSQGGYNEEYDVSVTASGGTFSIDVPKDNKLRIKTIEGDYAFKDEVLTLQVRTSFQGGRVFSYAVPCSRVD